MAENSAPNVAPLHLNLNGLIRRRRKRWSSILHESGAAALPEQIVPDWKPAPGFPGATAADVSAPAAQTAVYHKSSQIAKSLAQIDTSSLMEASDFTRGRCGPILHAWSTYTPGPNNENEIVLADQQSSRLHAVIQRQENSYVITDQNSTNGTICQRRSNTIPHQAPSGRHHFDRGYEPDS